MGSTVGSYQKLDGNKMKTLSDYTVEELRARVGERIYSLATNNTGNLVGVSDKPDREDYTLDMDWDNGNQSRIVWIFWATKVAFVSDMQEELAKPTLT
jgi:hypothetical protein